MRKIYFITLCFLIFLLCAAYNVSYHFMGSKIPLKAETEQTESETVLSAQVNGGDPMPVYSYYLKENQGCVSVYLDDGKTLYENTSIRMETLPESLQSEIREGKRICTEKELYDFLENYST